MESAELIKNYMPGFVFQSRFRLRTAHQTRVTAG